jgi:hypothetical protein
MKIASTAVQNLLATGQYTITDLYAITTVSSAGTGIGTTYVTSYDTSLIYAGQTYLTGWTIEHSSLKQERGVKTQNVDLTIAPQVDSMNTILVNGSPLLQAVRQSLLDSAQVKWYKAFINTAVTQATLVDAVLFFQGIVDTAQSGRFTSKLTLASQTVQLNVQMPRNLVQQACVHALYDGGCTVSKTNYTNANGVVSSVVNATTNNDILTNLGGTSNTFVGTFANNATTITSIGSISSTAGLSGGALISGANIQSGTVILAYAAGTATISLPTTGVGTAETITYQYPDNLYSLGVITFTACANVQNNGVSRTIRQFFNTNGEVQFVNPPPLGITAGDTFSIVAGCDKAFSTCSARFSNIIHFRGFPYVPQPETLYSGGVGAGPNSSAPLGTQGNVSGGSYVGGARGGSVYKS